MNPKVDDFLSKLNKWKAEIEAIRNILVDCPLTEELKWGQPCYTYQNKNVIIVANFKEYCAISFLKGVLLHDEENLLVSPGENSQSVKYLRFTNLQEIYQSEKLIKAYVYEAIELEKAGIAVPKKDNNELNLVEELITAFKKNPSLKKAFEALTPGRQRAYNMFFEGAKQSKTRETRIEKYTPQILNGKGINDCTCGLSKKYPYCDGSHKELVNR